MANPTLYPRYIEARLADALADTPVVLIHGPRQSGKTTLSRMVGEKAGYAYFSFDDDVMAEAARADPVGFVADLPEHTVLDEVQRVPQLFTTLKSTVDRYRTPGRANNPRLRDHIGAVVPPRHATTLVQQPAQPSD